MHGFHQLKPSNARRQSSSFLTLEFGFVTVGEDSRGRQKKVGREFLKESKDSVDLAGFGQKLPSVASRLLLSFGSRVRPEVKARIAITPGS